MAAVSEMDGGRRVNPPAKKAPAKKAAPAKKPSWGIYSATPSMVVNSGSLQGSHNAAMAAGLKPGSPQYEGFFRQHQQFTNFTNEMAKNPAPPGPGLPSGSPSGGGGGGYGPVGPDPSLLAAQNAIKSLFADYQKPADNSLQTKLQEFAGRATSQGAGAVDQLKALLGQQQNPYGQKVQSATVAANPLATYMQAGGVDSQGVDALRALLGAEAQGAAEAGQNMQDRLGQAWQNQQQGRISDADTAQALFAQQLASQQSGMDAQLLLQQQKAKDDLKMKILQLAVQQGVDLGSLGVTL